MFQTVLREPVLDMVSTLGPWSARDASVLGAGGSATWEVANRTIWHPIYVPTRCTVRRVWWTNGTDTAGAATITVALYADAGTFKPGARLVTANAVQGTASQVQFVSAGPLDIQPGLYWLALASTSATNTTMQAIALGFSLIYPLKYQEATGTPPVTATPVAPNSPNYYLFGFSTVASP